MKVVSYTAQEDVSKAPPDLLVPHFTVSGGTFSAAGPAVLWSRNQSCIPLVACLLSSCDLLSEALLL